MGIVDWLRIVLITFYAPGRAMREVRDRAALAPSGLVALIATTLFFFTFTCFYLRSLIDISHPFMVFWLVVQSGSLLVLIALIFSPLSIFLSNLLDRRTSFKLLAQQEYASLTSCLFYGLASSSLITTLVTVAGKVSGIQLVMAQKLLQMVLYQRSLRPDAVAGIEESLLTAEVFAVILSFMTLLLVFGISAVLALRVVFRLSWLRSLLVVLISGLLLLPASYILPILGTILASPFLLLMIFLLVRGYLVEVGRAQRARESFRQNLEAATLNPADSSAHYNLGLIHQQRGELDAARERFERAIQIDVDEVDAHYQLGRIARSQKRLPEAIKHFEEVVSRDPAHAQHEIWREVGATYLSAGQYEDARSALERFLARRTSDPEGLYLMGRAHAGLGHRREATNSMQACIEAVKTAPAYKYRAEKRWLNEAQQFLRSQV